MDIYIKKKKKKQKTRNKEMRKCFGGTDVR